MRKRWEGITSLRLNRKEQRVVASVAVTILHGIFRVALILLLVDPIDDVLVAMHRRFRSAIASAPRARRVLRT